MHPLGAVKLCSCWAGVSCTTLAEQDTLPHQSNTREVDSTFVAQLMGGCREGVLTLK
jgi:hypothetical protein